MTRLTPTRRDKIRFVMTWSAETSEIFAFLCHLST